MVVTFYKYVTYFQRLFYKLTYLEWKKVFHKTKTKDGAWFEIEKYIKIRYGLKYLIQFIRALWWSTEYLYVIYVWISGAGKCIM